MLIIHVFSLSNYFLFYVILYYTECKNYSPESELAITRLPEDIRICKCVLSLTSKCFWVKHCSSVFICFLLKSTNFSSDLRLLSESHGTANST